MTVRNYLYFMAELKGVRRGLRAERVEKVLRECQLKEVADRLIGNLSKGYRQRVGIAQAIVHDPKVLVLDEPTIGLDPKQIIQVRNMIKRLREGRTIILSTHILPEVSMTCDRVVIIDRGRVVAVDTPENLTRKLQGGERIFLRTDGPQEAVVRRLEGVPGVEKVRASDGGVVVECGLGEDLRPRIAKEVVQAGWGLLELRAEGLSLEEVFLRLTTQEEGIVQ